MKDKFSGGGKLVICFCTVVFEAFVKYQGSYLVVYTGGR